MRVHASLVLLTFVVCSPATAQEKSPPRPEDYGRWESLAAATLAPDGRWLAYAVNRVDEENELRVRGLHRDTTVVVKYATEAAFTPDSRWLGYAIGVAPSERERLEREDEPVRMDAGLLDLRTLDAIVFDEIASFRFSSDGRFLALRGYAPEGKTTADLIVRDLARATSVSFGNVSEFAWSDEGALLAFAVRTESGTGNAVQLYDAAGGAMRVLDSSTDVYRALSWRDDARDLAVLRTRVDTVYRDTAHVVLAWSAVATAQERRTELDPVHTSGLTADVRIAEHRTPGWNEDGTVVFIGLRPRERARDDSTSAAQSADPADDASAGRDSAATAPAEPRTSDVQVWHARDVRILPMQKAQEQQDLRRTLLAAWHTEGARVVRIGTDLLENTDVLEGGRFATETDRSAYAEGLMFGRPYQDVWLIEVGTGERRKVLERVRSFYGGSAAGRNLLWYDGEDYWTYDIENGRATNLTGSLEADFRNTDWDHPGDQVPPRGVAGWLRDDAGVLVYDEFDVWLLSPDGSGGRRLTDGAADGIIHRFRDTPGHEDGIDPARPLYLALSGKRSKQGGFARIRLGSAAERLVLDDARYLRLLRADSAETFAFTRERFDDSPDWFVAGATLRDARQVSSTNPFQSEFAWGRAELIDFTTGAGKELQGVLLYPAAYDASRRYAMIVYTYELLSQNLHNYIVPSERSYYNFNVWTANGYFVLMPDIVYRAREPGVSALEAVEPAVRSIIERGLVDSARIGLVGHSWGGYQATYLPTRTNLFAASVAGAPITNFLSFAGAVHWTPGIAEFDHWETGQARMDVPPWEDLEAHLRNSPIHRVHELRTPMLMMFGDADGTVDWHQGIEFYNFARRAGNRDFVMLVYPGEDHGLRRKENQVDYHRRILQWFGHWLKGDPAAEWITHGVGWLDRKTLLESR